MSAACVASTAHKLATNCLARRLYSPPIGRELRVGPPLAGQHLVQARLSLQWRAFASRRSSRRWAGVVVPGEGVDGNVQRDGLGGPSLDAVFSFVEVICIAPPAIGSFMWIVGLVLPSTSKQFHMSFGSRVFILQFALLVGAVVVGAIIRQRQWQRLCRDSDTGTNLISRIEKVEEDLRSSATIIRVLSRQLEKLGIRFRVTRKSLKEPISEAAVLAQKNSEATRALAMQEDILEKELGEIQKVLLAMQEQQQKQLELILAIGKAGRLLESKWDALVEQDSSGARNSIPQKKVVNQVEIQTGREGANDNKSQGY